MKQLSYTEAMGKDGLYFMCSRKKPSGTKYFAVINLDNKPIYCQIVEIICGHIKKLTIQKSCTSHRTDKSIFFVPCEYKYSSSINYIAITSED